MAPNPHFSLFLDKIEQKDICHTLTIVTGIMAQIRDKIVLEELPKLRKHDTNHLREMYQRNEHKDILSCNNNSRFEVGQPVMIKNFAYHIFEPKYPLDYRVLQLLNNEY